MISKILRSSPLNRFHAGFLRSGILMLTTLPGALPSALTMTSVANCAHQPLPSASPMLVTLYTSLNARMPFGAGGLSYTAQRPVEGSYM